MYSISLADAFSPLDVKSRSSIQPRFHPITLQKGQAWCMSFTCRMDITTPLETMPKTLSVI